MTSESPALPSWQQIVSGVHSSRAKHSKRNKRLFYILKKHVKTYKPGALVKENLCGGGGLYIFTSQAGGKWVAGTITPALAIEGKAKQHTQAPNLVLK